MFPFTKCSDIFGTGLSAESALRQRIFQSISGFSAVPPILTKLNIDISVKVYQKITFLSNLTAALLKNDSQKMAKIWVRLLNDSAMIFGTS